MVRSFERHTVRFMPERSNYGTRSVLQTIKQTGQLVLAEATWFDEAWDTHMSTLLPYVRSFLSGGDQYPAVATIFNQAINDYMSLMLELATGSGRSAVRSARSLIEHAVNLGEVIDNDEMAKRYLRHLAFVAEFGNENTLGTDLLDRKQTQRRRRIKQRYADQARASIVASIRSYGKTFRRSWTNVDLRTRADRLGLAHLYPAYRECSLVIHGASGGITGAVRDFSGRNVHRSGPILHLCPLAYITGVEAMLSTAKYCQRARPDLADSLTQSVSKFRLHWSKYIEDVANADRKLWPSEKPDHATAILAIAANGTHRWFWYDPDWNLAIPAYKPDHLSSELQASIDDRTREVVANPGELINKGSRFASIVFDGTVIVRPKPGARTLSASAILMN